MDLYGTGSSAGLAETGHAGLRGPAFFSSILILPEKTRKRERVSEKKAILVTFPPENISSSGDDDSSSGDDDSSSGDDDSSDDDSSSGGVFDLVFSFYYTQL
ncbi:hypothetical protein F2Q68_00008395 [Brassica cretica]|uniref:Uncharacterized protein n=1 Tax=Brassica cretica TaxID=69181 RepID=A0A8S9KRI0_BRACR|nr:hypothetical protein F2Q68_00008395 [Brassica cretica]